MRPNPTKEPMLESEARSYKYSKPNPSVYRVEYNELGIENLIRPCSEPMMKRIREFEYQEGRILENNLLGLAAALVILENFFVEKWKRRRKAPVFEKYYAKDMKAFRFNMNLLPLEIGHMWQLGAEVLQKLDYISIEEHDDGKELEFRPTKKLRRQPFQFIKGNVFTVISKELKPRSSLDYFSKAS